MQGLAPLSIILVLAGVALFAIFVAAPRVNEFFCLSVRDGKTLLVRGRIPVALHQELNEVLARSGTPNATLRGVAQSDASRLVVRGADERTAQRLRNVFGIHPVSRLRAAKAPTKRNLGQLLGFAWLAWWLV